MSEMGIAICRRLDNGKNPLQPGACAGFSCATCGVPLQTTAATAARIGGNGLYPLCSLCGVAVASRLRSEGRAQVDLQATPAALAQLDNPKMNPLIREYVRQSDEIRCAHCGAPVKPDEAKRHRCGAEEPL